MVLEVVVTILCCSLGIRFRRIRNVLESNRWMKKRSGGRRAIDRVGALAAVGQLRAGYGEVEQIPMKIEEAGAVIRKRYCHDDSLPWGMRRMPQREGHQPGSCTGFIDPITFRKRLNSVIRTDSKSGARNQLCVARAIDRCRPSFARGGPRNSLGAIGRGADRNQKDRIIVLTDLAARR
jgi:hypothetical protein